jgi:hypothetical protein
LTYNDMTWICRLCGLSTTSMATPVGISDYYDKRRYEARGVSRHDRYDPLRYANMADVAEAALDTEDAAEYASRSDVDMIYRPLPGNTPLTHEQWLRDKAAKRRQQEHAKQQKVTLLLTSFYLLSVGYCAEQ